MRLSYLILLASATALAADPGPAPLSLPQALRYAIEHSPNLDSFRRSDRIGELTEKVNLAGFFPSLDFSTTNGFQNPPTAIGNGYLSSQTSIAATENLWDNGQTLLNYRISRVNHELATLNLLIAREQLSLDLSNAYYIYSLNDQLRQVKELQYKIIKRQFDAVSNQYRQGIKTRKDFLRFQTQVQIAELDLMTARNTLYQSGNTIRQLLGAPVGGAQEIRFEPISSTPAMAPIPAEAPPIAHTYDYRVTDMQSQVNELNQKVANLKYWPQVNATAGITQTYSNYLGEGAASLTTNTLAWNALVTVNYNLWDWNIRRNNYQIAEETFQSQQDSLSTTRLTLNTSITNLMSDLGQFNASYKLSADLLKLSQESYDVLDQEYKLGKIAYLDLVTALNDLLTAKVTYYTNYYTLLQKLAQYRYYEGSLYDSIAGRSS